MEGLPFPSPGDLPYLGIKPESPAFQADALTSEPLGKPPICLEVSSNVLFYFFFDLIVIQQQAV